MKKSTTGNGTNEIKNTVILKYCINEFEINTLI